MNNPPLPTVPGGQTPAQPAAPQPVATPAPQVLAPEAMIEVKIDGKVSHVPVSQAAESFQLKSKLHAELGRVETMRRTHADQIAFAERFTATSRANPELASQETDALIERVSGRKLTRAQVAAPQSTPQPESFQTPDAAFDQAAIQRAISSSVRSAIESDPTISDLRAFQSETKTKDAMTEIGLILAEYPLFRADPDARMNAEVFMGSLLRANPNRPLDGIANEVHERYKRTIERAVNEIRDQRVQTAQATAAVPPNGTPQLTEQAEPFTRKDLKNGRLRAAMEAAYAVGRRVVQ